MQGACDRYVCSACQWMTGASVAGSSAKTAAPRRSTAAHSGKSPSCKPFLYETVEIYPRYSMLKIVQSALQRPSVRNPT